MSKVTDMRSSEVQSTGNIQATSFNNSALQHTGQDSANSTHKKTAVPNA